MPKSYLLIIHKYLLHTCSGLDTVWALRWDVVMSSPSSVLVLLQLQFNGGDRHPSEVSQAGLWFPMQPFRAPFSFFKKIYFLFYNRLTFTEKLERKYKGFPYTSHPLSPIINMLRDCSTFIVIHSYELKSHTLFTCPQLSANLLFLSQNPI